ncbi:hypothetical protein GBA52_025012 [Prunus armeniaca]|nr:hypothetical protein GBA52_025012 [Prunus armeniaca]
MWSVWAYSEKLQICTPHRRICRIWEVKWTPAIIIREFEEPRLENTIQIERTKVGSVNPRRKNREAVCDVEARKGVRNKESPNLDTMNKGLHLGFHDGAPDKTQPILVPMALSITGDTLRTTPYY